MCKCEENFLSTNKPWIKFAYFCFAVYVYYTHTYNIHINATDELETIFSFYYYANCCNFKETINNNKKKN